jgi:hypothetical protein
VHPTIRHINTIFLHGRLRQSSARPPSRLVVLPFPIMLQSMILNFIILQQMKENEN